MTNDSPVFHRAVFEAMGVTMDGKSFDDNELHQMAGYILTAIKR